MPRITRIVAASTIFGLTAFVSPAGAAVPSGPRSVAVVWFDFEGGPTSSWTAEQIRGSLFGANTSTNALLREQSFGAISLTGEVFGKYTISASTSTCDPDTWGQAARAVATSAGARLAGKQHVVFVFPRVSACGWSGLAEVPGDESFLNGTLGQKTTTHELTHNLGARHASSLRCTGAGAGRVSFSASCATSEYGDPFDVMGSGLRQTSAVNKVWFGFIPAANEVTVTRSGRYRLTSASLLGTGTQSLRIQRGATVDYWHFELRSPSGEYDNFSPTDPAVTGITVRLASRGAARASRTLLVDTNPATPTAADAPLQAGQSFADATTPGAPTVTLESVDAFGANVRVAFPGDSGPGTPPPSISVRPPSPPPVVEPPAAPTTVQITVRRVSRTRGVVRVRLPVRANMRCASRIGSRVWKACTRKSGVATITSTFVVRRSRVAVALRIDGTITINRRFVVPNIGARPRVTRLPIRLFH